MAKEKVNKEVNEEVTNEEVKKEEVKEEKKPRKPREVRTLAERIGDLDKKIKKYEELLEKAKKKKEELEFKRDNPSARQSSLKFDTETLMLIEQKGLDAEKIKELIKNL